MSNKNKPTILTTLSFTCVTEWPGRTSAEYGHVRLYLTVTKADEQSKEYVDYDFHDGIYVRDLEITNQTDSKDDRSMARQDYAWQYAFKAYQVAMRQATGMVKTFRY